MDKRKRADCGCSAAYGDDDEFSLNDLLDAPGELGDFTVLEVGEDNEAELSPDPRGGQVRSWRGLIAPYVTATGDGRRFALGALDARELPLPVKWQRVDNEGHKTSVVVGRIDGVDFFDADEDDPRVEAWGVIFDPDVERNPSLRRLKEDADEAWFLLGQKTIGPSVDLDGLAYRVIEPEEGSAFAAQGQQEIEVTGGRISAITLVQIPAFSQARPFALEMIDADQYAEMTAITAAGVAEGMAGLPVAAGVEWDPVAWVLAPDPTGALFAVGGEFAFPVAQLVDGELRLIPGAVADAVSALAYHADEIDLGAGVVQVLRAELTALTAACQLPVPPWAMTALVASAAPPPPKALFENPRFTEPTPVSIREVDGHLHYTGHVATWGVCHIGFPGQCVTAPPSRTGYTHFHLGSVETAEGRISAGKITLGGGHANPNVGFQAALAHYDDSGAAVADVRAGEDDFGIWVAGVVRAGVDPRRVAELASAPLSGDWRHIGGGLELVAALAVNTPGFPVVRVTKRGGGDFALLAAGALQPPTTPDEPDEPDEDVADVPPVAGISESDVQQRIRVQQAAAMFAGEPDEVGHLSVRRRAKYAAKAFL